MPPRDTALKTLRDAVKTRRFDGAYYIHGDDEYQKADAVRQLVDAAVDPATRDFNYDVRRGADVDAETFESLVATPPMMAERRVVVIRDAGTMKKDGRAALERYLKNPSLDTLLVLTSAPAAKADKTLQTSTTALEFNPLDDDRVHRWILHHASEIGATITEGAAELLHDAVGNDLYALAGELDKLASYVTANDRASIDEAAVSDVVGIRRGETVTDLLDRVLEKRAASALELVPHVLQQPKTSAVSVVMALATGMLAVAWGRARLDAGMPASRLESEYFSLLKTTGAYPGRSWGSAAKAWASAARAWSAESCDRALDALLDADVALKESRVSSEEQVLKTVVLAVTAG